MHPHPPKWFILECFFLALPPIPVHLACQRGAPEVTWLHLSGRLLLALSSPSGLLHTVSAGHHGTETEGCSFVLVSGYSHNKAVILCVWSTFSRLLRCPRLIKVMPSCLQILYSCASASSVRALVASSKTEKIKVREKKKKDLGKVWSGSPLKMKACKSVQSKTVGVAAMHSWMPEFRIPTCVFGLKVEETSEAEALHFPRRKNIIPVEKRASLVETFGPFQEFYTVKFLVNGLDSENFL